MKYWIGVASNNHVQRGVAGGFCQLCHGKAQPLKRMQQGDWIIYYSPKEHFEDKQPCQQFTAIGEVIGDKVYAFEMFPNFVPFRRDIQFVKTAKAVAICPLLAELNFIKDKSKWGAAFRYGHLEISQADFAIIAEQMLGHVPRSAT
ncbi:EVE domain-containing protein [Thiolinea disciformis]|uniref:EVE domain-containing protein n=1 Tax=Thiolinea disciformis TaxID=125614 RepID=UPI000375555B|nr:EVE domain-containing protein [Thiolinea disciformis]